MLDQQVKQAYGCKPGVANSSAHALLVGMYNAMFPDVPLGYKTPCDIGVEIEVENVKNGIHTRLWKLTNDGSLRNHGVELVSTPMRDDLVQYALHEYKTQFLDMNADCEFSHRCSIHVHINVAYLTVGQLRVLIATYLCLERLYFSLVREDRIGNSFCFPLADTNCQWTDLDRNNLGENYKYAALNPHHLVDFGTLEFRHHGGTKDVNELRNWIETILQLYDYVTRRNPMDIETTIQKLNTISNYLEFARDVLGDHVQQFLHLDLYKLMRDNVTAAKLFLN